MASLRFWLAAVHRKTGGTMRGAYLATAARYKVDFRLKKEA
jgi:hypothetical protein